MAEGATDFPRMAISLMGSDEFDDLYSPIGLSDRAYVSFLYRLLVDRDADGQGLETYSQELRDGRLTRESVALGMIMSSEFSGKYALN